MANQIDIVNQALTKLGEARIVSMNDDNKAARSMSSAYNIITLAEIRAHNWRFAIKRTELAVLADAPAWGYNYQYQVPSDYLRLVQVNDQLIDVNAPYYITTSNSLYQLEGKQILTNLGAPLKIRYVSNVTTPEGVIDTTQFDACFVDVLATRLAIQCCEDLTDSSTLKSGLWDEYKLMIKQAVRANAIEIATLANTDSALITGRT